MLIVLNALNIILLVTGLIALVKRRKAEITVGILT